jgi:hypothetical protein
MSRVLAIACGHEVQAVAGETGMRQEVDPDALHSELPHTDPAGRMPARARSPDVQKRATSCMIAAKAMLT